MVGYKGFDENLKCRGMQYKVGETHKADGDLSLCNKGLHFCENPMDVFNYYPPANSRYCEVEASGVSKETSDDSKRVTKELKLKAEIGLPGIIKAGVEYTLSKVDFDNARETNTGNRSAATNTGDYSAATNTGNRSAATNTGNRSAATNTGDRSAATNTGYQSAATNTGNRSAATNTGDYSAATNTGNQSAATNTGNRSAATNTGDRSAATNTGDYSAATNTGDYSAATNTGNQSAASVEGKDSVACVTGYQGKAKGAIGCVLFFVERNCSMEIIGHKSAIVDGEMIKADTYYTLTDGELVEVE